MSQGTMIDHETELVVHDTPDLERLVEGPPPSSPEPPFGPDDDGHDGEAGPPVSNARLGVLLFLGAEGMFFAGLLSAFLVFRVGSVVWPPPFQPRLPVAVTAINTLILLLSGYTMHRALLAIRRDDRQGLVNALLVTTLLGTMFLGVQGYEWVRLVQFGLTPSGVYGSTFYTLIGCHGLHVFGAVIWLLVMLGLARGQRFSAKSHIGVEVCRMYWYFVVALWPILFGLVYLY